MTISSLSGMRFALLIPGYHFLINTERRSWIDVPRAASGYALLMHFAFKNQSMKRPIFTYLTTEIKKKATGPRMYFVCQRELENDRRASRLCCSQDCTAFVDIMQQDPGRFFFFFFCFFSQKYGWIFWLTGAVQGKTKQMQEVTTYVLLFGCKYVLFPLWRSDLLISLTMTQGC